MLLLNNTKTEDYLDVTITKNTKSKSLVINKEVIIELETLDITKLYKTEVTKDLDLNRDEYFKFINHLAESINDYKKFIKSTTKTKKERN